MHIFLMNTFGKWSVKQAACALMTSTARHTVHCVLAMCDTAGTD